jgi:DNA repair exonuclease SbcCD nuclease subunit
VIRFEEKGLNFYGIPNMAPRSTMNPVASATRGDFEGKHVLLAHGSYLIPDRTAPDDHPFGLDDIDNSGFDYVALGHWHSFFELPTTLTKAAYCGSPETLAFDQTGSGHYVIVTLGDSVSIEKRKVGKLEWQEIELSSASFKYTIEVERELQKYTSENKLLRVKLIGLTSTDSLIRQDELRDHLADSFLYLTVIDKTETVPDELRKLNLPRTTILGQFVRQVADAIDQTTDEDEKELLEESLRTGYAMLSGKDLM